MVTLCGPPYHPVHPSNFVCLLNKCTHPASLTLHTDHLYNIFLASNLHVLHTILSLPCVIEQPALKLGLVPTRALVLTLVLVPMLVLVLTLVLVRFCL